MTVRFELFPSDLDATADFYTRVLRFNIVSDRRHDPQPYMVVQRDGVRIGASGRQDHGHQDCRRPPIGVELVLEVDDLDGELDYVQRAGWPLADGLQARPWGLRDFRLLDPSGYYLRLTDRRAAPTYQETRPG